MKTKNHKKIKRECLIRTLCNVCGEFMDEGKEEEVLFVEFREFLHNLMINVMGFSPGETDGICREVIRKEKEFREEEGKIRMMINKKKEENYKSIGEKIREK